MPSREITIQMGRLEPAFRSREQVARFFEGTDLVEPGLVRVEEWRPDPRPETRASRPCGARSPASADAGETSNRPAPGQWNRTARQSA